MPLQILIIIKNLLQMAAAPAPGASMPGRATTVGTEDIEEKLKQLRA